MYIKKSNGSRIEPWGTPASTFVHVDCTTSYYASVIAPLYFYRDIYKIRVQDRFLRNFLKKDHLFLCRALMNQFLACVVNIVEISCCIYTLRKSMSNLLCNVKIWRKFFRENGLEKVRPKFYLMYWAGANGSSSRLLNHLMPLFSFYTLLKSSKNPPANSGRPMYSEGFFDVFRRVWKENNGMKLVNGTF